MIQIKIAAESTLWYLSVQSWWFIGRHNRRLAAYDKERFGGNQLLLSRRFRCDRQILSMSQYVHLGSSGNAGLVERTYAQVSRCGDRLYLLI